MASVKPGDYVTPKALWNATMRTDKLPDRAEVLDVEHGIRSQSGTMVRVRGSSGEIWLDLAWFEEGAK